MQFQLYPLQMEQNLLVQWLEDPFIPARIQVLVGQNEQVQELVVGLVLQALQMEQNLLRVLE
jgi:hypothetical protein